MPASIRELINANVLNTLAGIQSGSGSANDVTRCEWAKSTGNPQAFPSTAGLYVLLFDLGDEPRESSPQNRADFTASIVANVYHCQSVSSNVAMQDRNASAYADVCKALMSDYRRGTHPNGGAPLAIMTTIGAPTTIDDPQAQGVSIPLSVWYRRNLFDPYEL